jgi:hypothetical protein
MLRLHASQDGASTTQVVTGFSFSSSFHANRSRLKLSTTPCRYSFVPFSSRIAVTSKCQMSFGLLARMPKRGFAGWMRVRGRRQPFSRSYAFRCVEHHDFALTFA